MRQSWRLQDITSNICSEFSRKARIASAVTAMPPSKLMNWLSVFMLRDSKWKALAAEAEIHNLPGNHETLITHHASAIAEVIEQLKR